MMIAFRIGLENRVSVDLQTELRSVQDRLGDLEDQQGVQSYVFGSEYRWNSEEDLELWFEKELP